MKFINTRTGAVLAGAVTLAVLGGLGGATASTLIGSDQIRDNSIRSVDVHDGTIRGIDLSDGVRSAIAKAGQPGASAYDVAVKNGFTGTQAEWLASLKGDQGAPGKDGANGTDGLNGTDGKDGVNGADGKDGASAYEVAVKNGFTGSETDWLASLKGDQGAPGKDGVDGKDGAPGLSNLTTDGPYDQVFKGDNGASLQTAVVKCDPGKAAIGGGYSTWGGADDLGGDNKNIQITVSAPYTDNYQAVNDRGSFVANEWIVKGYNNSGTDQIVRPWVVCATVAQ